MKLESFIGKRISAVEDSNHPILRFEDGSAIQFEGMGYDGLWTTVIWSAPDQEGEDG